MNKKNIITILSIIGFILITILLLTDNVNWFDNYIYTIIKNIRCDFLDNFFKAITRLGNTIPLTIIVICLMMFLKKEDRIILGTTIIVTLTTNQLLKRIIRRPRPPIEERLITQGGYSFPSGHSMLALCIYGTLIYLIIKNIKNKKLKYISILLLTIVILLIGISRIYLRVHYPSDVLAGFLLTIFILTIIITLLNNHFRGEINDKDVN